MQCLSCYFFASGPFSTGSLFVVTKLQAKLSTSPLFHPTSSARNKETAEAMITELGPEASRKADLDARAIVRLLGALQSNGFSSGIYLHSAMTNHSCRCVLSSVTVCRRGSRVCNHI